MENIVFLASHVAVRPILAKKYDFGYFVFCIMCSVAYAIDLLLTETAVSKEEVDAFQLGTVILIASLFIMEMNLPIRKDKCEN